MPSTFYQSKAEELSMTETDSDATLDTAMAGLRGRAANLGDPSLSDGVLYFGTSAIPVPDFEIVTSTQQEFGCEATILVARGDGFVRATTSIFRDGQRAVETELEGTSPAIELLRQGQSYRGPATILGVDYDAYYEPILDSSGVVIGAYLVALP